MTGQNFQRCLFRFIHYRFEIPAGIGTDQTTRRNFGASGPNTFVVNNGGIDVTQSNFVAGRPRWMEPVRPSVETIMPLRVSGTISLRIKLGLASRLAARTALVERMPTFSATATLSTICIAVGKRKSNMSLS